ncbi:GAF domain-containing sensor histidine kinase [Streptomyces sp. NPDC048639]|uniref:GAF domain-containing sensor histidine kinase n=1 Tax=Streptomyces sp. NPDC048639 TaxID=3365581 RepID=UPI003711AA2C
MGAVTDPQGSAGSGPSLPEPDGAARAVRELQDLPDAVTARLPRLLEAMVSVGPDPDLRAALAPIAASAARLTGARCVEIAVLDEQGGGPVESVAYGTPPEERSGTAPQSRLEIPVEVGGEALGVVRVTGSGGEPGGGPEFGPHELHLLEVFATQAGIRIANARLREAARRREHWIDGAAALTTALLSGDGDDALTVVAEQGRRLADAAAGVVLLPYEHGGLEIVRVASELPEPFEGLGMVIAPSSPVYGQLLAGEPVFVDDSAADPRMTTAISHLFGPSMMLPLGSGGRVLGTLALPRLRGGRPFTDIDRTLATRFAAQAALALVLAEAQRDRERLAVYEERDRIARDLHDLVIQRLFATGMMLEAARSREAVPELRVGIDRAVDELDLTVQEIRTAIFALQQGPAEAPSGLRTRIQREIGMAAVPLGFRPSVRWIGAVDARVGELTGKNLVAALREALSNAFRHASATRIEVVVDAMVKLPDGQDGVRLMVADDGVGIAPGGRRSGLRNLEKRAEALGGSSSHGPGIGEEGGGTAVMWEAPLQPDRPV